MAPITDHNPDLQRLQQEYSRRKERSVANNLYSSENLAYGWMIADRQKNILKFLKRFSRAEICELQIMELGCGSGGVIKEFTRFGATPTHLSGVDLLIDRLTQASEELADCSWINANGQYLPFQAEFFDLLLQFTAFSSILDPVIKSDMAAEMLRVLKPGGGILWYDFIWNPTNSQTRGIGLKEIKSLFQGCEFSYMRITLAPPIARLLLPRSRGLADWLSSLKWLNSHLLVWIQKPT